MSSPLWVAFDCETTGFLPAAKLLEIGAVIFRENGAIEGEFQRLVRPPEDVPRFITDLTGITTALVRDAQDAASVLAQFLKWLPGEAILVAHNIQFDLAVLAIEDKKQISALDRRCLDSLAIARRLGAFPNNRLETIADILQGTRPRCSHRALDDAHVVRQLMCHAFSRNLRAQFPELFAGSPVSSFLDNC